MSQPQVPGLPSEPVPPGYGGYGGELQRYRASSGPQPALPTYVPQAVPTLAPSPVPTYAPPPLPTYAGPGTPPPWGPTAAPSPIGSRGPGFAQPRPSPPERPAVVSMAANLAVTGSLQFLAALTLLWLLAVAGNDKLGTYGADGVMFHLLNRFDDRMVDGLVWPLYGFPLAALVLGLLLPTRRPWTRIAFSALGLVVVVWLGWLFRANVMWLAVPAIYIAFTSGIVWTAAASRWYGWRPGSDADAQPR